MRCFWSWLSPTWYRGSPKVRPNPRARSTAGGIGWGTHDISWQRRRWSHVTFLQIGLQSFPPELESPVTTPSRGTPRRAPRHCRQSNSCATGGGPPSPLTGRRCRSLEPCPLRLLRNEVGPLVLSAGRHRAAVPRAIRTSATQISRLSTTSRGSGTITACARELRGTTFQRRRCGGRRARHWLMSAVVIGVCCCAHSVDGQVVTGTITGVVRDHTHAALPAVTITVYRQRCRAAM